ncbi:MAG: hypothetical protein CMI29_10235 [Opitutae bacterium]|nr:hypothetical protein [Opitutae bacterium]|tara:strand:+ start:9368 stop:11743 length:2376 start_codon:yes stop_codon:yes gene_type:complete
MNFLNVSLALGAAAVLVPLIIHLFNRSRFKVVNWGAMHLLESVIRVNRKQVQLEQLILLLIRCAIPILLALCLARMVVTDWGPFLHRIVLPLAALTCLILFALVPRLKVLCGLLCSACLLYALAAETGLIGSGYAQKEISSKSMDVPSSSVILMDDSFSMNADGGFDTAGAFAEGFLKKLKKGSEATLVRMGGSASPIFDKPTSETKTLGERSGNLRAASDRVDLAGSFDTGIRATHDGQNAKREIILVSDFRKSDWERTSSSLAGLKERLENETLQPAITFIDVGGSSLENVSVESIDLSASSVGVGQKVLIRAELRNHGTKATYEGDLPVRLFINDEIEPVRETVVSLKPGETGQVLFPHEFSEAGSSTATVEIGARDALDSDNRRSSSIAVLDRIGVLLVDGAPSEEWLQGETDFLKIALTPFEEAQVKKTIEAKDLIEASVIRIDDLTPADIKDGNQSVIVLANVPNLKDDQVRALASFVRNGGGLWLCLGDQVDGNWYNKVLGSEKNDLLPLDLFNLGGSLTDDSVRTKVVASYFEHPALSLFNDRRNGNLSDADLWRWHRLDESDASAYRDVTILARMENGDAFLAEKKVGKGVVIQMATSVDGDWSNVPVRSCYLPLAQQITTYLADQVTPPRNLPAGATFTHYLPEKEAGTKLTVQTPDGSTYVVKAVKRGTQAVAEFSQTREPGTYEMSGEGIGKIKFVALASTRESLLERMSKEEILSAGAELSQTVDYIDASEKDALSEYLELDGNRTYGREMWKYLLLAVVLLIFLEVILQRVFGRVNS